MKNITYLLILVSTVILTGCMNDDFAGQLNHQQDGKTQLILSMNNLTDIQTYSDGSPNECYINDNPLNSDYYDFYVLSFGSDGIYKSGAAVQKIDMEDGDNGHSTVQVAVPQLTVGDKFVVLLNTGISLSSETQGLAALHPSTSTVADINTAFPSDAWNINKTGTNNGKGMPMSSTLNSYNSTASTPTINIYRSVAKIQLSVSVSSSGLPSGVSNFTDNTVTWAMANDATKGAIYSGTPVQTEPTIIPSNNDFHTLIEDDFTRYGKSYTGGSLDEKTYYLPEYTSSTLAKTTTVGISTFATDRACMVVKHNNKYYRLDLAQKQSNDTYKYLDIKRNCYYTVNITKVKSVGYETFEEALANPPSNLEYEIVVEEGNDNIIVSNGQYAMSLECDKMIAYAAPSTEMTIKMRAILGSGSSDLPATNSITPSTGIVITEPTATTDRKLSTTEKDIKFTMSGTNGSITVQLGNLSRTINITRNNLLDAHFNHKTITGNYSSVTWLKADDKISITVNGTTSITINTGENIIPKNASALTDATVEPIFEDKKVEGYAVSSVGCTKVLIVQKAPDYVGWAGGDPNQSGTTYYSKRLVVETIEEGLWENSDWSGTLAMQWYSSNTTTGPQDRETGKANTRTIGLYNSSSYQAAYACWMKNDANGDGTVTSGEFDAAGWYLPAQAQLEAIWMCKPNIPSMYAEKYWSSSVSSHSTTNAWCVSLIDGDTYNQGNSSQKTKTYNVRCVREI